MPRDSRAEWIRFPAAVDARAHTISSLDSIFRRTFTLDQQPRVTQLAVRAAKRLDLKINGARVEIGARRNWKEISTADVLGLLQTGTNTIEARVFDDDAPPALWLVLSADQLTLPSDETWEVSVTGSTWHDAVLASRAIVPGAGNAIAGGEQTGRTLGTVWPLWLLFAGIALVILIAGDWGLRRLQKSRTILSGELSAGQMTALLLIIASLWVALFWHNAGLLPFRVGFDSEPHLNYIKYVQERRSLPLPTEGFEMFQPPLYYVLSAVALSACHLSASDSSAILVLRILTMLFGIAHFTLVFFALHHFFPGQIAKQIIGLVLAAFLPMQLYLSHFVTNETLAAVLVTAALYVGVLILQRDTPSVILYSLLGLLLGAAILTKTTGVLLVPPLLVACTVKLITQRSSPMSWVRTLGLMLAICLAVCGWHYLRIWRHFGTPVLGNWDVASGFAWWQDPGYRTVADYFRFGRSLITPLFSGFAGFADGIYSTLWGDALCAGSSDLTYRPPWNYNLMVAGYLLALVPTFLMAIGAVVAAYHALQKPSLNLWLLLSFSGLMILGVIFMTLKVASYAQVKAFYALSTLTPLCIFGTTGWDVLTRGRKLLQFALGTILLTWAMNSFASVWIPSSAPQHLYAALRFRGQNKIDIAASEAAQAVKADPSNTRARQFQAAISDDLGHTDEALEQAEKAVELNPAESFGHLQLGIFLRQQRQTGRAVEEARRAIELGPENLLAYNLLATCLLESARNDEAFAATRDGLAAFPFDAELHYALGLAAGQKGDFVTATNQFAYALLLRKNWDAARAKLGQALHLLMNGPDRSKHLQEAAWLAPDLPEALDELAWLLATHPDDLLRNGQEATRLAQRACELTGRKDPVLLATLAAAYGETGRFPEAISTAKEALSLAQSSGNTDTTILAQNLLTTFQANRPYRNDPAHAWKE